MKTNGVAAPFAAFDIIGRKIVELPFDVAVQVNGVQELLEAHGMGLLILCKACITRTGMRGKSVVDGDFAGGNTVTMTCPCTKRLMRMGGPT